jgi:tetratricopeptide (TPR) repeat protein
MTGSPRIVLVTSIPPRLERQDAGVEAGEAYQHVCVQSWEECGIRVLSANDPGEIPPLAAAFPGIEFIPTEKNAAAQHGKNTPYIADLLKLLAGCGAQAVGIINADIVLEPHPAWRDELPDAVREAIIGVHRHDITALSGSAPRRYPKGFDLFLFQPEDAARLSKLAGDFAMGVPWWDCWLAAATAFMGRDFRALVTPRIAHLEHGTGFSLDLLHTLSKDFASFVATNVEAEGECPPRLAGLHDSCRALAAITADDEQTVSAFNKSVLNWHKVWTEGTVDFAAQPAEPRMDAPAASVFYRFEERIAGHPALIDAIALERHGALEEASRKLQRALEACPNEFEILMGSAEFKFRRGAAAEAIPLLERAVRLQSDSPRGWNSLGVVLNAVGRREEAIASFERIAREMPDFLDVYYNLAIALLEAGRLRDAIQCTEQGMRASPNSEDLRKLHRHLLGRSNPSNRQ